MGGESLDLNAPGSRVGKMPTPVKEPDTVETLTRRIAEAESLIASSTAERDRFTALPPQEQSAEIARMNEGITNEDDFTILEQHVAYLTWKPVSYGLQKKLAEGKLRDLKSGAV